jgi:hypothetical protein
MSTAVANEIVRAAEISGVELVPLSPVEEAKFWASLQSKFNLKMDGQLWCQMEFAYNKFDPEGWRALPTFFSDWPNLMFCDPYKKVPIYRFSSSEDLVKLLGESFHFVFYLSRPDLSKVAVFDDHECLRVT